LCRFAAGRAALRLPCIFPFSEEERVMFARSRHRYAGLLLLLVLPLAVCADDEIASDKAKT